VALMPRVVPPVYSPLDLAAILSGVRAAAHRDGAAETEVRRHLSERLGAREVQLTGSGTAALTLALRAAAAAGAVPVALPAYCCYDIATAADGADVPVLLYDIDPTTLGPNFDSLERALAGSARTIVMAHLYGLPVDADAVHAAANRYGALVIDDAAQGAGASWRGRPLGTLGSLGVLSFGRGKGITAGRGGALLANDARGVAALETVQKALAPARTAPSEPLTALAQWLLARPALYAIPASLPFLRLGETVYHPPTPPRAMSRFAAGVLRRTALLADAEAERRRTAAGEWVRALAARPGAHPFATPVAKGTSGALRQPVLVVDPSLHAQFSSPAARRLGILPAYPTSLADLEGFRGRIHNATDDFSGARKLASSLFTLPTHSRLDRDDRQRLAAWLRQA
jgi:perosamine synthetase